MTAVEHDKHQRTQVKVIAYLERVVKTGDLRAAPTRLHIDMKTSVKPDLFWVAPQSPRCRLMDDGWHGAPDLLIEIVSPVTEAIDRSEKYELYQGKRVYEYWLVNPIAEFVEVYVLLNKRFVRHGVFLPGETFNSGVLNGRKIDVAELFD